MCASSALGVFIASLTVTLPTNATSNAPAILDVRLQEVGDKTYFYLRFQRPEDLFLPTYDHWHGFDLRRRQLAQLPRLVSQDASAWAVYPRIRITEATQGKLAKVSVNDLEFVGRIRNAARPARFRLLYVRNQNTPALPQIGREEASRGSAWNEFEVEVDFKTPRRNSPEELNDIEREWASSQAHALEILDAQTPDFGFYGFAREATVRKYHLPALLRSRARRLTDPDVVHQRMYETTTGSAAITETLAMNRLLRMEPAAAVLRSIDVSQLRGIDVAEHPWQKMMLGKTPSIEPVARLIPHHNFYVNFKKINRLVEFRDLLHKWGTTLVRGYEFTSRDYDLVARYEKQMCIRCDWAARTLGPSLVESVAITGSDGYLRDGSDLTLIFEVTDHERFLQVLTPLIAAAREKAGEDLVESKDEYHGITISRSVSPQREVSLYRASLGDYVICSNSSAALGRVVDTFQRRQKSLADSPDFQYMRTVFRFDDPCEDGFAFFSDAFVRQLVGPASKIKAARRLEALTSLQMLTHGALFTAWETEKLPVDQQSLLDAAAMTPAMLGVCEGDPPTWDAKRQLAISKLYNTIHFLTPLIELPIDKITPSEESAYKQFRQGYLEQWRQYFDPVGIRLSVRPEQLKIETYILPLIRGLEGYEALRQYASGGSAQFDRTRISAHTLLHGMMFLSNQSKAIIEQYLFGSRAKLGDYAFVRIDDSRSINKAVTSWVQRCFEGKQTYGADYSGDFPLTIGLHVKDPVQLAKVWPRRAVGGPFDIIPPSEKREPYRGIATAVIRIDADFTVHHAIVEDFLYLSLSETALKNIIDESLARKDRKTEVASSDDIIRFNASIHLSPSALAKAEDAIHYYLEWETHRRALANNGIWHALYRANVCPAGQEHTPMIARKFLGFVPESPDGMSYTYDEKNDEVVNVRHGSYREPRFHTTLHPHSPVRALLAAFPSFRADLLFREDGIHTIVTVDWKP